MTHHALVNNEYLLALGLTLYHVLWQGAAVGLLGLAFTVFLRRSRPQARYIAAYSALVFMTALTLGTLWWCTPARNAQEAPAVAAADKQPATFLIVPTRPRRPLPSPEQALASLAITAPTWAISAQRPLPLLLRLDHQLYAAAPWLGVAWLGGIALMALRLLASLAYTQSLRHIGARPVEQRIAALLEDIALRMRVSRAVRALESVRVKTPCIIGTLRPVILLPAAVCCGLTPAALGAVLAHELAHIRRHDFLLNLLQNVMLTLLFFHPAAWWLSRRIRIERELCCDDLAVATHGNPHAYAEALSRLAELAHSTSALAPAMSDGSLVDRIRYVLAMPEQRQHGARGLAGGAVLATIVLLLVFGSLGGPQEARAQQSPPQVPV
ncbi:MAG: M56 family metallopeptidase, partial [Candidatus Hydrogenedentes bacterium]|nr:M56 family metallopeptidase [Candidatus Hydrogenedentota bacterium]